MIIMIKQYENLLSFSIRPLTGLLINKAGLNSPGPMDVKCICKKARYTSLLVSKHFFIMCSKNPVHVSACPWL